MCVLMYMYITAHISVRLCVHMSAYINEPVGPQLKVREFPDIKVSETG